MFTLYILHSKLLDRYYIGYTNDIERRLAEHNRKKGKYTDAGIPWVLVYTENVETSQDVCNSIHLLFSVFLFIKNTIISTIL